MDLERSEIKDKVLENSKAYKLFELVMKIGIPNTSMTMNNGDYKSTMMMRLKWAAAEGPQPADFDEERGFAVMQAAYYMLFNYCKYKCINLEAEHNMRVNFKYDMEYILGSAWSGVNGWRV